MPAGTEAPAGDGPAPGLKPFAVGPGLRLLAQVLLLVCIIGATHVFQASLGEPSPASIPVQWSSAQGDAPITLPHRWSSQDHQGGEQEYRGRFELARAPSSPQSLLIHDLGTRVIAHLNGRPLWLGADTNAQRQRFRPLIADIPAEWLQAGPNELRLRVQADPPGSGYLGRVEFGDSRAMHARYLERQYVSPLAQSVVVLIALVLGSVSLMLALGRRHDGLFLAHAVICASGSLFVAAFLVRDPPLPGPWWDSLHALSAIVVVAGGDFLGRYYVNDPVRWPRHLRVGIALGLLALAACIALLPERWIYQGLIPALVAVNVVAGTYRLGDFWIRRVLPRPEWTSFWIFLSVQLVAVAGVHDSLLLVGAPALAFLPWIEPSQGLYLPFAVIVPLAVFSWVVLQRYLDALRMAETLNSELSERVAQREREIERSYAALHRVERERATAEERERLLADMHDGLGGTLVAALARLENENAGDVPAARAMRTALDDLRLILDSSDPVHGSLRSILSQLRERLEPVCEDASITLHFDLDGLPDELFWPPRAALNLLRIVQEACSNAIRHSGATRLHVCVALSPDGGLQATVDDNGCGFAPQPTTRSQRGLVNLRRRAASLGGEIRWIALTPPGTRTLLTTPAQAST